MTGDTTEEYDADVSQSQPTQSQAPTTHEKPKPLSRRAKKALKSARKSTLSPIASEEAEPSQVELPQSVSSSRQSTPASIEEAVGLPVLAGETVDRAAVSMQVDGSDVFGPASKTIVKGRKNKSRKYKRAAKRPLGESESEPFHERHLSGS